MGVRLPCPLEHAGEKLLHLVDSRFRHHQALIRAANQAFRADQLFQLMLDQLTAVEVVKNQQRVGPVEKVLVFDPAIPILQGGLDGVPNPCLQA